MDGWCTENCRLGNCPPTLCTCDCRVPTQVLVCKPDSSKFGPRDDGVKWCLNTCRAGHCPRDYCQCHILYRQQPRPVTEGLWGTAGYCYRGLLIEAAIAIGIVSPQQMSLLWTFFYEMQHVFTIIMGVDVQYGVALYFKLWLIHVSSFYVHPASHIFRCPKGNFQRSPVFMDLLINIIKFVWPIKDHSLQKIGTLYL